MGIGVQQATKKSDSLESNIYLLLLTLFNRGGIAVVWLGVKNERSVAMKQFPKHNKQADSSANLELQMQQIILKHTDPEGKFQSIFF